MTAPTGSVGQPARRLLAIWRGMTIGRPSALKYTEALSKWVRGQTSCALVVDRAQIISGVT